MFEIFQANLSTPIALPMTALMLQALKVPWEKPSSVPVLTKRMDHIYWVQEKGTELLFTHSKPHFLMATLISKGRWIQSLHPNKEERKLVAMDKRFYTAGTLGVKNMNCLASIL